MKKQLFALSLTVFLVGCVRNNQQREVTYAEFLYQTNGKETIQVPDTAKVTQTIKVKTINYEKLGKDPENYTHKYIYNLVFAPDGSFVSTPDFTVLYSPFAASSEDITTFNTNDYYWTYYLNPMRVVFQKTIYADGITPHETRTFRYDYTFGDHYWITKVVATTNLKYSDPVTKVVAERVEVETVTYSYNF